MFGSEGAEKVKAEGNEATTVSGVERGGREKI